jgi:hypothetical protein
MKATTFLIKTTTSHLPTNLPSGNTEPLRVSSLTSLCRLESTRQTVMVPKLTLLRKLLPTPGGSFLFRIALLLFFSVYFSVSFAQNIKSLDGVINAYSAKLCTQNIPSNYPEACADAKSSSTGSMSSPNPGEALKRNSGYVFCGAVPGKWRTNSYRVNIYSVFVDKNASVSFRIDHTQKVTAFGDYRWDHFLNLSCESGLIAIKVEYVNLYGGNRTPTVEACRFYPVFDDFTIAQSPAPQIETYCEPGRKFIRIPNPNNYKYCFVAPTNQASIGAIQLDPDRPIHPYTVPGVFEPQRMNGYFLMSHDLYDSENYFMFFGTDFGKCGYVVPSAPVPLSLVLLTNEVVPETLDITLRKCSSNGGGLNCNVPGINYFILPNMNDSLATAAEDSIRASMDTTVSDYSVIEDVEFTTQWTNNSEAPMPSNGKICYDDLKGGKNGCREYTYTMNYKVIYRLEQGDLNMPGFPPRDTIDCSVKLLTIRICQELEFPLPRVILRCSPTDSVQLPCTSNVDGVRWYLSPNAVNPIDEPPLPPGMMATEAYSYYHCGDTAVGNTTVPTTGNGIPQAGRGDSVIQAKADLNLEERFRYNDNIPEGVTMLYASYIRYRTSGLHQESQRVPIAIITVPDTFNHIGTTHTIDYPLDGTSFCSPESSVILNSYNPYNDTTYRAVLDSLLSEVNNFQLQVDSVTYINPFEVNFRNMLVQWTGNITYNGPVEMACWNNLDSLGGSCGDYQLQVDLEFDWTAWHPCSTPSNQLSTHEIVSCSKPVFNLTVCKRMYPPKPGVKIVCDKDVVDSIIIETPIDNYPFYKLSVIGDFPPNYDTIISDTIFSFIYSDLHDMVTWNNPNLLRLEIKSLSQNQLRESAQSPYLIFALFIDTNLILPPVSLNNPLFDSIQNMADYCTNPNPELLTYHDLFLDYTLQEDAIRDVFKTLEDSSGGNLGVTVNVQDSWTPYIENGIEYHNHYQGKHRVCVGHLPYGEPDYLGDKSITYKGLITTKVNTCINTAPNNYFPIPNAVRDYDDIYGFDTIQHCFMNILCDKVIQEQIVFKTYVPRPQNVKGEDLLQKQKIDTPKFLIYPNPFESEVLITWESKHSAPKRIFVSDINGRELMSKKEFDANSTSFDLKNFSSGVYLVHIINSNGEEKIDKIFKH